MIPSRQANMWVSGVLFVALGFRLSDTLSDGFINVRLHSENVKVLSVHTSLFDSRIEYVNTEGLESTHEVFNFHDVVLIAGLLSFLTWRR